MFSEEWQRNKKILQQDWFRPVHYVAIRPCTSDYDQTYWRESGVKAEPRVALSHVLNAQLRVTYYKGTLEEFFEDHPNGYADLNDPIRLDTVEEVLESLLLSQDRIREVAL